MTETSPPAKTVDEAQLWLALVHGSQGYGNTVTDDGGRDGHHPYIYHLVQAMQIAGFFGFVDPGIQKGCLGHDSIEDTNEGDAINVTCELLLAEGFSRYECDLIWACTDGTGASRHERKLEAYRKIRSTPDAVIVKLADRIANVTHALMVGYRRKVLLYQFEQGEFRAACEGAPLSQPQYADGVARMWYHLEWLFSDEARQVLGNRLDCCIQPAE